LRQLHRQLSLLQVITRCTIIQPEKDFAFLDHLIEVSQHGHDLARRLSADKVDITRLDYSGCADHICQWSVV
jgi:hypothetical protein